MEFLYVDLGFLRGDEIIEVILGTAANVHLLDSINFNKYKCGYDFYGYGGYIKRSPYRISVPNAGKWYLTFDLGGYSGTIKYNYNIIRPQTLKTNQYFVLADRTIVYFDELPEGKVKLNNVIRDGMSRGFEKQIFNSIKELKDYCNNRNWGRY